MLGRENRYSDPCNIELNNVWVCIFLLSQCTVSRTLIIYRECLSYLFSEKVRFALFSFRLAGNIIEIFINKINFFCEGGTQINKKFSLNKMLYCGPGLASRYGMDSPMNESRWERDLLHRPQRPWSPPIHLYNEDRVFFPGGKGAGA